MKKFIITTVSLLLVGCNSQPNVQHPTMVEIHRNLDGNERADNYFNSYCHDRVNKSGCGEAQKCHDLFMSCRYEIELNIMRFCHFHANNACCTPVIDKVCVEKNRRLDE